MVYIHGLARNENSSATLPEFHGISLPVSRDSYSASPISSAVVSFLCSKLYQFSRLLFFRELARKFFLKPRVRCRVAFPGPREC